MSKPSGDALDDTLATEAYLFEDGGADSARCVSLFGTGDDVPDSGHIRFPQGCLSLSWGLCEEIKRKAPGVRGFKVQVILTPNDMLTVSGGREATT